MLGDLLEERRALHEVECSKVDHQNPLLVKWFYKKTKATHKDKTTTETTTLKETVTGDGSKFSHASPSDAVAINIKIENPEYRKFAEKLGVLRTAKTAISKLLDTMKDLDATIKTKSAHEQQRFDSFGPGLNLLDAFASAFRGEIAAFEMVDASSLTADVVEEADTIIAQASGHADGSKILVKRVRAILGRLSHSRLEL